MKLDGLIKFQQFILFLLIGLQAAAQPLDELSLIQAWELLEQRYPLLDNEQLLDRIYQNDQRQISLSGLPVINLKGDGRFQTESTSLDAEGVMLPFEIDLPLYSLRSYLEANYVVLDGGLKAAQQKVKAARLTADRQQLVIERYALRERVNQLFVGINLLREQAKLFDISLLDLEARKEQLEAGLEMGVVLESELKKIEVRELELQGRQTDLGYQMSGMIALLSEWTGVSLQSDLRLVFPDLPAPGAVPPLDRPEQQWFEAQRAALLAQSDLTEVNRRPKLNAFAQAGIGYPNPVNLLDNGVAPYGIIGAGFSWPITDWKKEELDKERLSLQAEKIVHQKETFEFNLEARAARYRQEVARLNAQIERDREIAGLQADILRQLTAQLEEGVIKVADYVTQFNTELAARQQLTIHRAELLKLQLEFLNERGDWIGR